MKRHRIVFQSVTRPKPRLAEAKRLRGKTADVFKLVMARTAGVGKGMRGEDVPAPADYDKFPRDSVAEVPRNDVAEFTWDNYRRIAEGASNEP